MRKKSTRSSARKTNCSDPGWRSAAFRIARKEGLHTRPAAQFAKLAQRFAAEIEVRCGAQKGDGKSVLSLLALGAEAGRRLTIRARGPQAREALKSLGRFIIEEREMSLRAPLRGRSNPDR